MSFGPEYHKIQTAFKRDAKNQIVPGDWSLPELAYLADVPWRWTEKVDGTNIRVHWDGERVTIGGRTDNAQIPTFLLAAIQPKLAPEIFRVAFPDSNDVTLYGEGYGAKIQSGGHYRPDCDLVLFDTRVGPWWLLPDAVADVASKVGLDVVPEVLWNTTLTQAVAQVEAASIVSRWPGARIEGIVGTPAVPLYNRNGERIIVKLKLRDFDHLRARKP